MTVQFKTNELQWDENERTGFRHVTVSYKGNNIISVLANRNLNTWEAMVVPMGYSYKADEINFLEKLFKKLPYLLTFLETDGTITYEDMTSFIENMTC